MTQITIQAQVDAIKKATQEALKSKESALKFLTDAGIVKEKTVSTTKNTSDKKK